MNALFVACMILLAGSLIEIVCTIFISIDRIKLRRKLRQLQERESPGRRLG